MANNLFKDSSTFTRGLNPAETSSQPSSSVEDSPFDFSKIGSKKARFDYDSEGARNFDQTNVDRAKEGVKEIISDAINKAKTAAVGIREEARKQGFDEGHAAGFGKGEQLAKEEFQPLLETLQKVLQEFSVFRKVLFNKAEREMVEMVLALAKKSSVTNCLSAKTACRP